MSYESPKIVVLGKVETLTKGKNACGEPDHANNFWPC